MLESVQPDPTSFCPIDSPIDGRIGGTPGQPGPDADTISTSLREASFVSRPWVARDIVAGMDDSQLAALARQDGGRDALQRWEERRVGKACVSTCRSRWSPEP